MAVSVGQFAVELRLATDANTPPPEPLAGVLLRTLNAASAMVEERVIDGAPGALVDSAVVAVASYLYDRPSAPAGTRFSNAWRTVARVQCCLVGLLEASPLWGTRTRILKPWRVKPWKMTLKTR